MRVLAVLACCLSVLSAPVATQAEPTPEETYWHSLSMGLGRLDQCLIQQLNGELWPDVRDSVQLGIATIERARALGASQEICQAVRTTLRAVLARQDLLEREAFAEDTASGQHPFDDAAREAWLEAEYNAVYDGYDALADDLLYQEGQVPRTSWLLVELLFAGQRDNEAAAVLSRALAQWSNNAPLHEQAKAWAEVLPAPELLAAQLRERVDLLDFADSDFTGLALETIAQLQTAIGKNAYQERDFGISGAAFHRAALSLQRAHSMPRQWGPEEIAFRRADNLINSAYSFLGLALDRWADDRNDEKARLAAEACEEQITTALRAVPDHSAATQAVLWLGDHLMNKGDPMRSTLADKSQARDLYGRMAKRFDNADWWNNYAFWCRETGSSNEAQGNIEEANKLYEKSYAAYVNTIELAPENARYINDTGLMLFYHLERSLDEAESLFTRSWMLGEEVCSNPFVEEAVFDQNFSAYTDAILNLARLYLQRGDLERADETVSKLIELAPERLDAQMTRREIDQALGSSG